MSVVKRKVTILVNGDGEDLTTVRAAGEILRGAKFEVGTLTSGCDITITDEPTGTTLLAVTGADADATWQPMVAAADPTDGTELTGAFAPPVVWDRVQIAIANGTEGEEGEITLLMER